MKRKYTLVGVLGLLFTSLACSLFSNAAPTITEEVEPTLIPTAIPEILFQEKEFANTGCFYADSTNETKFFVDEGAFHIDILATEWYALSPCLGTESFTDFILDVDVTQLSGADHNLYGVMLRYDDINREYYYFAISGDGNYTFVFDNLDAQEPTTKLIPWTSSSKINTSTSTNHIRVIAQGNTFELYVNEQLLEKIQDDRISNGTIGFVVATSEDGGAHIKFDNVVVTRP